MNAAGPDESSFSPSNQCIIDAYRHVFHDVNYPSALIDRRAVDWVSVFVRGDYRRIKIALREIDNVDWSWTVFDEWLDRFSREGEWPYMWHRNSIPDALDEDNDDLLRKGRAEILAHFLTTSTYARMHWEKMLPYFRERGHRLVVGGDNVEAIISAEMEHTVLLDDWRTWPPFFPGDRTSLTGNV